jgi:hypothetical protein
MRPRTKLLVSFTISALATASLTLAPRAHAYWRFMHAGSCFYSNYGHGFYSAQGELNTSGTMGVWNTDYVDVTMVCPDNNDSNTWGGPYTPIITARFQRPNTTSPPAKFQACSAYIYGSSNCTGFMTGTATGFFQMAMSAGQYWSYNAMNYVSVPLPATQMLEANRLQFLGVTIGTEVGPKPPYFQ